MKVKIVSKIGKKSGKRFIALVIDDGNRNFFVSFDKTLIYELLPEEYSPKYLLDNDAEIFI